MADIIHHPSDTQEVLPFNQVIDHAPELTNIKRKKGERIIKVQPNGSRRQFDSLQSLLEQAGYKETRIFTPVHKKTSHSPSDSPGSQIASQAVVHSKKPETIAIPIEESNMVTTSNPSSSSSSSHTLMSDQKNQDEDYVNNLKAIAATSSWFQTSWNPSKSNKKDSDLKKKQSESALPNLQRRSSSWSLWFGRSNKSAEKVDEQVQEVGQDCEIESSAITSDEGIAKNPPLRHASSTKDLWQASLKHHRGKEADGKRPIYKSRSMSAKTVNKVPSPRRQRMMRQQSYDGARVVAGVGVRAASFTTHTSIDFVSSNSVFMRSENRPTSLRQAYGDDAIDAFKSKEAQSSKINVESQHQSLTQKESRDSVSSLGDVEEIPKENTTPKKEVIQMRETTPFRCFSTVAPPIVSKNDAVAMRNVGCLNFEAGRPDLITSLNDDVTSSNRIRKMRSVDALELALARMQSAEQMFGNNSIIQRSTIPESSSVESFTQEDFANATSTDFDIPEAFVEDQFYSTVNQNDEGQPIRCLTPTLMITSPTGARPPQPLILDGVEFEPRSVSPKASVQSISRPVPKRGGWKIKARAESYDETQQRESILDSDSTRGRTVDSKELNGDRIKKPVANRKGGISRPKAVRSQGSQEHLQAPALRKRPATRSCHNLGASARSDIQNIRSSAGKLSGSQQIRALQRSVQRRECAEIQGTDIIPSSPTEVDDDDPFSDFVALTQEIKSRSSSRSSRSIGDTDPAQIDRSKMSPVPFQKKIRSTLGENQSEINSSSTDEPLRMKKSSASINAKAKSNSNMGHATGNGVGLACLVDLNQQPKKSSISKQIQPTVRQSSLANYSKNNSSFVKTQKKTKVEQHSSSLEMGGDENVNPLLDSPTARAGYRAIAKKRSTGHLR